MHLWTLVHGQVSRTALANPLPPSVTTMSDAGIGAMRADSALEFSDLAMCQETTLSPLPYWMARKRYEYSYRAIILTTIAISLGNAGLGLLAVLLNE